jgi:hypothetical protein
VRADRRNAVRSNLKENTMKGTRFTGRLALQLWAAGLAAITLGCTAATGAGSASDDAQPLLYEAPTGPFVDVRANGTGCPAGTWRSEVSEDGTTFSIMFDQYEASVGAGSAFSIKDCTLGIQLAPGSSYAVESFTYRGDASLAAGQRATFSANYWFQGTPAENRDIASDLSGPLDNPFMFVDAPAVEELQFSPCGVQRDLNVTTRVVLRNAPGGSSAGSLVLDSAEGAGLEIKLAQRGC